MIYFDAAATTLMSGEAINELVLWVNKGNPSADYPAAINCRELMKKFREELASGCGFVLCGDPKATAINEYRVIFTSCATESNSTIIRSVVDSYIDNNSQTPHIIISSVEHKSIISLVDQLVKASRIEVSFLEPNALGFIDGKKLSSLIKDNTCLISVMAANNETGAMNDIKSIASIAHKNKIPFHTDAVQSFGKFGLSPVKDNIDAFSLSFHKFGGPVGVGALVIREAFIKGFKLQAVICGSQNSEFRGGTENIPGIAASRIAYKLALTDRAAKNKHLVNMKQEIIDRLSTHLPCKTLQEYYASTNSTKLNSLEIVFLSLSTSSYLPNILMLAVVKRTLPEFCNVKLKQCLIARNIIISIGSACNTHSKFSSHVLTAMNVPLVMKKGIIRISMMDNVTIEQVEKFVTGFVACVQEVLNLINKPKTKK